MTEETRVRILALRAEGMTWEGICRELGVGYGTVAVAIRPERAEGYREASRAWKERNRAANRTRDRERAARIRAGEQKRTEAPFYRFLREMS